jgi:hypothetical protein
MSRLRLIFLVFVLAALGWALWVPGPGWGAAPTEQPHLETLRWQVFLPFLSKPASVAPVPEVSVSPRTAAPGDELTVAGAGFTPANVVQLSLIAPSGERIALADATARTDDSGRFNARFHLPASLAWPSGTYTLDAYDLEQGQSAGADFQVAGVELPPVEGALSASRAITLTITPPVGPAGTAFTVRGMGLTPGGLVRRWFITAAGQRFDFLPLYLTADADGQFQETFVLPANLAWPLGGYTYYALDVASNSTGTTIFTVTAPLTATPVATTTPGPSPTPVPGPSLSITPTVGTPLTVFTVRGAAFTPAGVIQQWLVTPAGWRADFAQLAVADAAGNYTVSFFLSTAVTWPFGTYTYYALDIATGRLARVDFQVTGVGPAAPTPTPSPTSTPGPSPTPGGHSLSISPASGTPGTVFTVNGTGFTPNGSVQRWVVSPAGRRYDLSPLYLTADPVGHFTQSFYLATGFTWPSGVYTFYAYDVSAGQMASVPFTIGAQATPGPTHTPGPSPTPGPGPMVSINPPAGTVGMSFTVTGTGFTPFGTVEQWLVSPAGQRLNFNIPFISADALGRFSMTFFLTGAAPPGTYTYYARNLATGQIASVTFNITGLAGTPQPTATPGPSPTPGGVPGLSLAPAAGTIGTPFTVVGFGFTPRGTIQHWLIDPTGQRLDFYPSLLRVDAYGRYSTTFAFPPGRAWTPGVYVYHVYDFATGLQATASFTLSTTPQPTLTATPGPSPTPPAGPGLSIDPAAGVIGLTFTASATGLTPGGLVELWLLAPNGGRIDFAQPYLVADLAGRLTFSFAFPPGFAWPFGTYRLVIRDQVTGRSASVPFELVPTSLPQATSTPGPSPTPGIGFGLTISPTVGAPGTRFDVTGTGFTGYGLVQVWLTGPAGQRYEFNQPTVRADATGRLDISFFLVGTFPTGTYTFHAHDIVAIRTATVSFQLITGPTGQASGPPRAEYVERTPRLPVEGQSAQGMTPAGIVVPGLSPASPEPVAPLEETGQPGAVVTDVGP